MTSGAPPKPKPKLTGRDFYNSLGSPKTIVAPMVEQSELAWRLLSRRHSPSSTLCYTPMLHSRLFATAPAYRSQSFYPPLDGSESDRPLFVQFCSNTPEDLFSAARHVAPHCDGVDLNLGCPQGIARKGKYGAFLQEDWGLIRSLVSKLHKDLEVPVTAKIRILETRERSLEYARMVIDAGAQVLTVHGRTRDQKGHNTGMADWGVIRYIRDNLPKEVVLFANGNILWHEDVQRCLDATGADGVMSAEGNLYNPAIFQADKDWEKRFPRMDIVGREYLDIVRKEVLPGLGEKGQKLLLQDSSITAIKPHLFKLWHALLPKHTDVRAMLAKSSARTSESGDVLEAYEACLMEVEKIIKNELSQNPEPVDENGRWVGPDTPFEEGVEGIMVEIDGVKFNRLVPWYRCQPYYRPLPEEAIKKGALKVRKGAHNQEICERKKQKLDTAAGTQLATEKLE
ncbi:dihydrouridine synthase-domain-containing protein [Tuber borchii]|uniref:tRNA-dihydrouridine(16/17) synthase [NAD(P)(+)] n=1 Tax=Tuber borchii TaxID=42251 RepID=A0A2T7A820_TUBBO|nr:dihydrouridine synthase-domain-containing protein [Tuber borchii]